ncbi:hypothetical protein Tco_0328719 [Tanacetum coccineum]
MERENTKGDIALMVVATVRKEHERTRAELLSQILMIAKRQRTSKKSTYIKGESSSSQTMEESPPSGLGAQEQQEEFDAWNDDQGTDDDEVPFEEVSPDFMAEISRKGIKSVSTGDDLK